MLRMLYGTGGHRSRGCLQKRTCKICNGRHLAGLHEDKFQLIRKIKADDDARKETVNSTAIMDTSQSDAIGSYHGTESIYEERNSCNEPRHPTTRIREEVAAFEEDSGSYTPTHSECEDGSPDWNQLAESNRAEERCTKQERRAVRNSSLRRVDSCWTAHHIKQLIRD